MKSAPAIGFDYHPSHWLSGGLLSIAALAVLAVSLCGLPGWLRVALGLFIAVCTWRVVQQQRRVAITAVRWSGAGDWFVRYGDTGEFPMRLGFHRLLGE